ncbi:MULTISPECIES: phage holin family protein [Companilactobacillus]|nr:phage holin family protein [Companilactobacillus nodensis]
MDILQSLQLINVAELTAIVLVCYVLTAGAKKSRLDNKYMPFISMAVGLLVGLAIAGVFHDGDLGKAGLTGFLAGGYTSGLFTGIKGVLGGYENSEKGDK